MKQSFSCVLALTVFLISCGKKEKTIHAEYRDLAEAVYASGNLYPHLEYKLFATADGTLMQSLAEEGQKVAKGTVLFIIDREVDLSRLNSARLALEVAEKNTGPASAVLQEQDAQLEAAEEKYRLDSLNFHRYKNLYEKEAVNLRAFEEARLAFQVSSKELRARREAYRRTKDQLTLELSNARTNFETQAKNLSEHAPVSRIDGKIYQITKEEGEAVRRGELLAVLGSADSMFVRLNVDELDIQRVKAGQEVLIRFDIDQQKVYKAKVRQVFPLLNKADQSFRVEAEFVEEGPQGFYGLTLEANILIRKKKNVLTIPRELLQAGDSVEVMADGESKKVHVKTGAMDWDYVEIREGITEQTGLIQR